jgi:ABC-type uncharacterized transport system permease subunit
MKSSDKVEQARQAFMIAIADCEENQAVEALASLTILQIKLLQIVALRGDMKNTRGLPLDKACFMYGQKSLTDAIEAIQESPVYGMANMLRMAATNNPDQ